MGDVALAVRQVRYTNRSFWRNPASAFFTFAFPLMFLVIFTSLLGNDSVQIGLRTVNTSTYYVASMAAFAVITACFTNVATTITFQRDAGVLKRTNGTPLPAGSFLGARMERGVELVLEAVWGLLIPLTSLMLVWYGAILVRRGQATIGSFA